MRLLLAALAGLTFASPACAGTINIALEGVKKKGGSIVVCLWEKDAGFPDCEKGKPLKRIVLPSDATSARFDGLSDGSYAVSAFHDVNDNGELDTNFIGLPSEAVGLSNNPRLMGPPRFKPARFDVAGETKIILKFR